MKLAIKEIDKTRIKEIQAFIRLERRWMKDYPLFVPDMDKDTLNHLTGKSSFFDEMDFTLFMAMKGNRPVARCAAMINPKYQRAKKEAVGFIGFFAADAGQKAGVKAMFEQAESWLKNRGVTRVIAPFNGAASLGLGLLATARDKDPMFPFGWHPHYYSPYLESCGYARSYPLIYYTIDFSSKEYQAARQAAGAFRGADIRPIDKGNWYQDLEAFGQIFNETFKDEWAFHPLTTDELHEFFDPMKPVLDPRQMLMAETGEGVAGFCLGLPDWTPLFRSFKGRMGLVQILKMLVGARRYKRAGLIGIGVAPSRRGTGLARALALSLYRRYEEKGLKQAFYYPVNKTNTGSRRFAQSLGGKGETMYDCFDKTLA